MNVQRFKNYKVKFTFLKNENPKSEVPFGFRALS